MRRITMPLVLIALACACTPAPVSTPAPTPADYAAALADPIRPASDIARDEARKPAELLAFAQIAPGEAVGDYVMGGGYFTRILAAAVGPKGRVHAFQPQEFITFRAAYADEQRQTVAASANILAVNGPIAAPAFSAPLDTIITIQNFHDLYLKPFPADTGARASSALFRALKPGGTLVVVDHSAVAGSGTSAADTLHRIELRAVVDVLTQAGFKLEAESAMFARLDDPRTAIVFDPAIRGKTDQFVLRFRKPG
jgi:predicted methyltransferase